MGLLDDAIREHLELKRRHGANPDEVARQEQEALGAPRRAEFARPEGDEAAQPDELSAPSEPSAEGDEPSPTEAAAPSAAAEPVAEAEEPVEAGDEREPFDVDVEAAAPSAAEPPASAEPPAEAAEPPTEEHTWLDDERDEVPAEEALDHPRPADPESGEDVLEETPEFLQETPEHDRLWFEQRPPRDFDWDK